MEVWMEIWKYEKENPAEGFQYFADRLYPYPMTLISVFETAIFHETLPLVCEL